MKSKRVIILFLLAIVAFIFLQNCGTADSPTSSTGSNEKLGTCPSTGYTAFANTLNLQGNCQIVGHLHLSGNAILTMTSGTLSVAGNIVLKDKSQLIVTSGSLTFPQTDYSQYSVTLNGQSNLKLIDSDFVTNSTGQNNFSMGLDANDDSIVEFNNSNLDSKHSWLLGNFRNNSKLNAVHVRDLPTEVYPFDASKFSISSGSSIAGYWLDFISGSSGTVNIPKQDVNGNYTFSFGPTTGLDFSFNMSASKGRLGINTHPNSAIVVNGNGASSNSDVGVVFGYYIENNTGTVNINGLTVGSDVTRKFSDQGRSLQLNHVNLNPFSWQLYVSQSNGFAVSISDSIINEIGVMPNGIVNLSNCVLQLAITGAFAPGAKMSISNSHIWSQAIQALNGGEVEITNSHLHGNYIAASGAGSKIKLTNVVDLKNGISPQSCDPVAGYPPNNNGIPLCSPFNTLYQCSQVKPATAGASITASPSLTCAP